MSARLRTAFAEVWRGGRQIAGASFDVSLAEITWTARACGSAL